MTKLLTSKCALIQSAVFIIITVMVVISLVIDVDGGRLIPRGRSVGEWVT